MTVRRIVEIGPWLRTEQQSKAGVTLGMLKNGYYRDPCNIPEKTGWFVGILIDHGLL